MAVASKICGLNTQAAVNAAVAGGARFVGFNFYGPSPRHVTAQKAAELALEIPDTVAKVGLFVNAEDDQIAAVLAAVKLDYLQLHGDETPERVQQVKQRFGLPVIKAVAIAGADDVTTAHQYEKVADMLLLDAKPPKDQPDALPGGNGLVFDWDLIAGERWGKPWMLAGGLTPDNLPDAVAHSHAEIVDVSSGVEDAPGQKSCGRIQSFLATAAEVTP